MPSLTVGLLPLSIVIPNRPPIITLLTDFGTQDYFVGAMKGVILSLNPAAQVIDITHDIPPQDIHAGAFNLLASYRNFPARTIHLAVVDPGVGSNRRPILVECAEQYFVGPDNGLFGWICEREGQFVARRLSNEKFWRQPASRTFHGRDIFAPVAAALSTGISIEEFGPVIDEVVRLEALQPARAGEQLKGTIIHIDRFGNCITNFTAEQLPAAARLNINGSEVIARRKFFSEDSARDDELFMIEGSAGFVEVAVRNGSAAAVLKARPGQPVMLLSDSDHRAS